MIVVRKNQLINQSCLLFFYWSMETKRFDTNLIHHHNGIHIMALLLISFSKRLELIDNRLSMSVLGRRDARGTVLLKYHTLKCYC